MRLDHSFFVAISCYVTDVGNSNVKTTDYLLLRCLDFNIYTYTMSRRPGTDICALKGAVPQLRVRVR